MVRSRIKVAEKMEPEEGMKAVLRFCSAHLSNYRQ
jgi:hypothetical protein